MHTLFQDRAQAGRVLAERLVSYRGDANAIVLGLPRGGVPVAYEVAKYLHVPLDVFLVRKLGVPWHEELAMGALASDGTCLLNQPLIDRLGIGEDDIADVVQRERKKLEDQDRQYRRDRAPPILGGKCVVLVDDGVATGSTMLAAATAIRAQDPAKIVVAAPVGAREAREALIDSGQVDEVLFAYEPDAFYAVGAWYEDFDQTSDEEVRRALEGSGTIPAR